MEETLHCNRLECRKSLHVQGRAVVTTCLHIFCVECANQLFTDQKKCPACQTLLDRPDDVVVTSLNPSVDYRTSVLAGLTPNTIMDIAMRSLHFWQYQRSQETAYLEWKLEREQREKSRVEQRLEFIMNEAKQEIQKRDDQIQILDKELRKERERTHELQASVRAMQSDFNRLKIQYDRMATHQLVMDPIEPEVGSASGRKASSRAPKRHSETPALAGRTSEQGASATLAAGRFWQNEEARTLLAQAPAPHANAQSDKGRNSHQHRHRHRHYRRAQQQHPESIRQDQRPPASGTKDSSVLGFRFGAPQ